MISFIPLHPQQAGEAVQVQNDIPYPMRPQQAGLAVKVQNDILYSMHLQVSLEPWMQRHNEAAAVASFAAPNTIFSVISFILGHFDAALIQQD